MEFNTVSISDGITMGTEGMRASLVSREVIADSIELVARGNGFDGLVVLVGCDKTIPAGVMALARLDVPGLVLYGGSIAPGKWNGHDVTIQDVYEAIGAHAAGRVSDADLASLESAKPALQAALAGTPGAEARRRLEEVLRKLDDPASNPPILRFVRAVAVLEQIRTPGARQLLQDLARGQAESQLTQRAGTALTRLD